MSFIFSFGRFARPRFQVGKDFVRVVFGPVGLIIMGMDIDDFLGKLNYWKDTVK